MTLRTRLKMIGCLLATFAVSTAVAAAQRTPDQIASKIFARYDKPTSPGCAVGLFENGRTLLSRGFGMADLDTGRPIDGDTIFNFASTSKQFTSLAAAMLIVEGSVRLQDDVRKWIPELPDYGSTITVDMLMHHTSGLRDYLAILDLASVRDLEKLDRPAAMQVILRQKGLNFEPGRYFSYSNTNYFLLAEVVERASGMPFHLFAQERIFAPLGMTDSYFRHGSPPTERTAHGYDWWHQARSFRVDDHYPGVSGDGGLMSSINDLAKFDADFHAGAGARLWTPDVRRLLLAPGLTKDGIEIVLQQRFSMRYAGGLMIGHFRGQDWLTHDGAVAGFRAEYTRLPQLKLSAAVLCNRGDAPAGKYAADLLEAYAHVALTGKTLKDGPAGLESLPLPKRHGLSREATEAFARSYHSEEVGGSFEFSLSDQSLDLTLSSDGPATQRSTYGIKRLKQDNEDTLVWDAGWIFKLERDPTGTISGFTLSVPRARGMRFVRQVPSLVAYRAIRLAEVCVEKAPENYNSVWGSRLDFGKASTNFAPKENHVSVLIPETQPKGKPGGLGLDVNVSTGECLRLILE